MNKIADLTTMKTLVDIKYRQQQESFSRLIAQETKLRVALKKLDGQLADSRNCSDASQRALGADVLWQAWIGRKKRELNMQLAQVLAVKEKHIDQVRQAYGKVLVTDTLLETTKTDRQKQKAQLQLERAILSMQ